MTQAYFEAERLQAFIGKPAFSVKHSSLIVCEFCSKAVRSINIRFKSVKDLIDAQLTRATELLEDRVCSNLGESDRITSTQLSIGNENMIEGTVCGVAANGKPFTIAVQMLWNYRYGENSANGVLTIYPQFRGTRNGEPMEGKAQKSKATAEKDEAKAARAAAKAERNAKLREKFGRAPERLAKEQEKWLDMLTFSPERTCHYKAIADACRALTKEDLDEMFAKGARTSGDLESILERRLKGKG